MERMVQRCAMTIKADIDFVINSIAYYGRVRHLYLDCSVIGGKRIFGGDMYRGHQLVFIGESRATKLRKEAEREASFKEAQTDAFQQCDSNHGPQT